MVSLFDKAKALPKEEHSEIVRSAREYEKYQSHIPSVGEMSGPTKPGEIVDKKFPWETMLAEQGIPTADFFRITTLLSMIIDQLDKRQSVSTVSDFTKVENILVPAQVASAGRYEQTIQSISPYGYIYIPNNPTSPISSYRLYKGFGKSELIYAGTNQVPIALQIPHIDNITIQFDTDVSTQTVFQIYQSVRPFTLASGGGGASLAANLYSPYVSTYWYDQQYTYGGVENSVALTNNNIYVAEFEVPRQLDVVNAGISVTTASITAGDRAKLSLFRITDRGKFFPLTAGDVAAQFLVDIGSVPVDAIAQPTVPFVYSFMPGIRYGTAMVSQGDIAVMGGRGGTGGFGRSTLGQIFPVSGFHRGQGFAAATPAQILGVLSPDTISPYVAFQAA